MIELTDDGTLDTVVRCTDCQMEYRFAADLPELPSEAAIHSAYQEFVAECIAQVTEEHECEQEERCDECGEIFCICYDDDDEQ